MAETHQIDPIRSRRTARRFDPDRPVADAILERVLTLGTLAPSPMNLQPWRFLVVRDPGNRKKLRLCTFGEARITEAPVALIVLAYLHPDRTSLDEVVSLMLERRAIDPEAAAKLKATAGREWRKDGPTGKATRAATLAAGTLMLAAESLGLASAWLEGFDEEKVRRGFGIPDDHALCGLVALGYPLEEPPFPGRLDLPDVCFAEHFGQPWPSEASED